MTDNQDHDRTSPRHTSGLPFKSVLEEPTLDATSIRDNARSYAMTPLLSEPGAKYLYSNAGINTAGRIIEVVSGKSFEQFLDERLFGPLGLVDTTFWPRSKSRGSRLLTSHGSEERARSHDDQPAPVSAERPHGSHAGGRPLLDRG